MKKFIVLLLSTFLIISACSNNKNEYTKEEIEYIDTINTAIDQTMKYYEKLNDSIRDTQNYNSDYSSNSAFSSMMGINLVNDTLKKEVTPPKRFKELHEDLLEGTELLSEVSLSLPVVINANDTQGINENVEKFSKAIKIINDVYDELPHDEIKVKK